MAVDVVLVRHGSRAQSPDGRDLSGRGRHQARTLADALALRGASPDLVLSSSLDHARATALLLSDRLGVGRGPVELRALTPGCGPGNVDELIRQTGAAGVDLDRFTCVLVVGHEGRLSNLLTEFTGRRTRPIPHGGAVCVSAASVADLASGRGRTSYRYPTADHQEDALRAKVNSKMTVSTFLAGFVFTALSTVLIVDRTRWPLHRVVAAIALTASLALFISAVYIYDQLSTPSGFWTVAGRPRLWRRLYERQERRAEHRWERSRRAARGTEEEKARQADDDPSSFRPIHDGPMYWLMVDTSRRVFTPAVALALVGFVALLLGTGDWRIEVGGLVGLVLAGGYAALHRPDLGAD
jgi:phosphohistidine phosphatase SixA